jgi:hypothetical protein
MHSDSEGDVPATVSLRSAPWCKISTIGSEKSSKSYLRPDGLRRLYVRRYRTYNRFDVHGVDMHGNHGRGMSCHHRRGCQLLAVCRPVQRQEAFSLRQVWAGEVEAAASDRGIAMPPPTRRTRPTGGGAAVEGAPPPAGACIILAAVPLSRSVKSHSLGPWSNEAFLKGTIPAAAIIG